MRVFVTGATGFVGTAVVRELLSAGHEALGLARSDSSAAQLTAVGAQVHRGGLEDIDSLRSGAAAADGVIHLAFIHDFSNMAAAGQTDLRAVEAIGDVLAGSNRPFVVTSGSALLNPGHISTEDDAADARSAGAHRVPSEIATIALASRGVRSSIIRLPPSVHGQGDHGFVPILIGIAREKGLSAYVGDGLNRWPAVHRVDAVRLYRFALEKGVAGSRYHAIGDGGIPTRDIAAVIGRHLGVPVAGLSSDDAAAHFGWISRFFGLDCPSSSAKTQAELGWQAVEAGLIEDMEAGHYFETHPA